MLSRLRPAWRRSPGLLLGAAFSLALVLIYLWSRGGQATDVRIVVQGNTIATFVDGRPVLSDSFNMASSGGISVLLNPAKDLPSLPSPNGIDRLTIRALDSGQVLFAEDFNGPPDDVWEIENGKIRQSDGAWEPDGGLARLYLPQTFGDFILEARFKNVSDVEIGVRTQSSETGAFFALRPYRLVDSSLALRDSGDATEFSSMGSLQLHEAQTLRGMAAMLLRPVPLAFLLLAIGIAVVSAAALLPTRPLPHLPFRIDGKANWALPAALAVFALVSTAILIAGPAEGVPHVPDELSYIFQARVLAEGRFSMPPPLVEDAFRWSNPAPILIHNGRWASMYPPIHPLMLAFGEIFNAMLLVPPLLAAGCVLMLFAVGRRLYGQSSALMATLLFAISPFLLMTGSNFMSHNTAAFFMLAALYCLSRSSQRLAFSMGTGVFLGLLFATRPLTGVSVVPAFGLLLLAGFVGREERLATLRQIGGVTVGGLLILAGYLFYQGMATGDPFLIETTQGGENAFGFGGAHSLAVGLSNEQTQMSLLLLVLHNWTPAVGLLLVFLPFALGSTNRWDWFLLFCAACLMGAYTLYFVNGVMHGPRYWYEATPLLALLSARGVSLAAERLTYLSGRLLERIKAGRIPSGRFAYAIVAVPVLVLALQGSYQWLLGSGASWRAEFTPDSARALKGFNGINGRFTTLLKDADLENALVLVDECGSWHCYGIAFWLNSPSLDGEVVYARYDPNRPDMAMDLLAVYPDRLVYRANFFDVSLEPFRVDGQAATPAAPRARDIVLPGASPGPRPISSISRDQIRLLDLEAIQALLVRYREAHGEYPRAPNPQTLCRTAGDAGCVLKEFGSVPLDPTEGRSYVYWSDGESYAVLAVMEVLPTSCEANAPDDFRPKGVSIICVTEKSGPPSPVSP